MGNLITTCNKSKNHNKQIITCCCKSSTTLDNSDVILDLSLIFNETGYINYFDENKYSNNNEIINIILMQSNNSPIKIGYGFLYNYVNLKKIYISDSVNIVTIGNFFLGNCVNLTNFDTEGLTSLITIGTHFLYNCTNLINFDTVRLTKLTTIGNGFLWGCNNNLIITIKNPPMCLYVKLAQINHKLIQLYDKPCIYLNNICII